MIAHNKTLLENQFLINQAQSLQKAGFISPENLAQIEKDLPVLKTQKNILIRLGMAFLGLLLYSSICGFISLLGINSIDHNFQVYLFIYAAIGFAGAEFFAQQNTKEQGLDDTFLIGGQILLAIAIGFDHDDYQILMALTATLVSFLSYLRYTHLSSVFLFCVASTATIGIGVFNSENIPTNLLTFILMGYAAIVYFLANKATQQVRYPFYHLGLVVFKNFGLVLFYLAGNYLIVRELSVALLNLHLTPKTDIPLAWFFYTFTILVPVLYIYFSIKLQQRAMLWIGFLAVGFSIYTIRMYHHVLPPELALTLGGLILFALTTFCIKRLKHKTTGLSFVPDKFANSQNFIHSQALMLTSQFGIKPETTPQSPMEFGGGDFSGGGSGGGF
ncbi:MAG: hypothetical protein QG594_2361 [Bacteroidota bacterium]|nr:hypothetical protein [Bacteroidota bacterium]